MFKFLQFLSFLLLFQLSSFAYTSTDSSLFQSPLNYEDVFDLAKNEGKSVMLYFHFDQCGACRQMERSTLVDQDVIDFFNENFISYEINTKKGEGIDINKLYEIRLHPAFVFLDHNGNELNKIIGSFTAEEFIAQAKNALDPKKTLEYFKNQYSNGHRDADFLFDYCYRLKDANELDSLLINDYLRTQSEEDLLEEKNIRFVYEFMIHKHQTCIDLEHIAFQFMSENKKLFTPYFNLEQVNTRLFYVTSHYVSNAAVHCSDEVFWKSLERLKEFDGKDYEFKEIWGGVTMWTTSKEHSLNKEIRYYKSKGDVLKYQGLTQKKINKIWDDTEALNSFAWANYINEVDEFILNKSLECVVRSIELNSNYNNNDTYAALLYKTKQYVESLVVAERAVQIAKKDERNCDETLSLIEKIKDQLE